MSDLERARQIFDVWWHAGLLKRRPDELGQWIRGLANDLSARGAERDAVLEEAAQRAERFEEGHLIAEGIAANIRALKSPHAGVAEARERVVKAALAYVGTGSATDHDPPEFRELVNAVNALDPDQPS